jgi:predicted metal-dependent phosphotriesterase family hydrolase
MGFTMYSDHARISLLIPNLVRSEWTKKDEYRIAQEATDAKASKLTSSIAKAGTSDRISISSTTFKRKDKSTHKKMLEQIGGNCRDHTF